MDGYLFVSFDQSPISWCRHWSHQHDLVPARFVGVLVHLQLLLAARNKIGNFVPVDIARYASAVDDGFTSHHEGSCALLVSDVHEDCAVHTGGDEETYLHLVDNPLDSKGPGHI